MNGLLFFLTPIMFYQVLELGILHVFWEVTLCVKNGLGGNSTMVGPHELDYCLH